MFEINLVPDVKAEMIAAQKKRNVVFFASLAVSIIAGGLVLILLGIKVGQDVKIGSQDSQLKLMSDTIEKYDGLGELLTVQKQLTDLETIGANKRLLSRAFTVLHSIVGSTTNGDTISITTLNVALEDSALQFDGQARAGASTDGLNYRVLESFKKTIGLMKYDYGRYVDKNGNEIPTMCIFEANNDGETFVDKDRNIFAVWAKGVDGCDPSKTDDTTSTISTGDTTATGSTLIQNVDLSDVDCSSKNSDLVCIYRTPKFDEWSKNSSITVSDNGEVSGIEHFVSACIKYSKDATGKWKDENDCYMAPDGLDVQNSTDGKETSGNLVLMFTATLYVNPDVFSFANKHMITIVPNGKQNVTDSYIQVGDMFAEKAKAEKEGNK